jgi:hypothetical protein
MGPMNAYKDMLDNVVSPITCVSMNHQNQLKQMANRAMFATPTSMWQHQCHKCCKEPNAPFQNQAHRSEISFSKRQCREREDNVDPCTHTWPTRRYFHQTPRSSNFHSFAGGAWCVFDFVWEVLCSICIASLCVFLAFDMAYVSWCIGILVS